MGRVVRVAAGGGAGFLFVWLIINHTDFVRLAVPEAAWWVAVAFAFYYLPDMIDVGLSRRWGRWPQPAAVLIAVGLLIGDIAAYGSAWAPPVGWFVFELAASFYGSLGISFVVAGVLAVPG